MLTVADIEANRARGPISRDADGWDDGSESIGEFGESLLSAGMLIALALVMAWLMMLAGAN